MQDKVVIITGASHGLGLEASRQLKALGAEVVMVGRNPVKTRTAADKIKAPYYLSDFSKLTDVRALAEKLKKAYPHIDVLINNAGGVFAERQITDDGLEKTLQVNHLAPFLLTNLLMPSLVKSRAKVINTSSVANKIFSDFDIDDLNMKNRYTSRKAYGNAKLANIF